MDDEVWALVVTLIVLAVLLALGIGTLLLIAMAGVVAFAGVLIP